VQPAGRSRPAGYLFSDQGILNVALGTPDERVFVATYERALRAGYLANSVPHEEDGAAVVYLNDGLGTSVELLYVSEEAMGAMGFIPKDRETIRA
jgi:hypothetical protein